MASKEVVFALVPGSFATPQIYDKCEHLLHAAGHQTLLIDLLTANDGSRLPPATTTDDVQHIRSKLLSVLDGPNLRNIVLALHSYAGIPGTSAIEGLNASSRTTQGKHTAVVGVLYITAHIPRVGESIRSIMVANFPDLMPEPYRTGWPGQYMPAVPRELVSYVFSDLENPAEVERYGAMMTRHASDAYSGECTFAGWECEDVECVLILPELDATVPVVVQEWEVARTDGKVKVRRVEGAAHCVNVSRPEVVVEELITLAENSILSSR